MEASPLTVLIPTLTPNPLPDLGASCGTSMTMESDLGSDLLWWLPAVGFWQGKTASLNPFPLQQMGDNPSPWFLMLRESTLNSQSRWGSVSWVMQWSSSPIKSSRSELEPGLETRHPTPKTGVFLLTPAPPDFLREFCLSSLPPYHPPQDGDWAAQKYNQVHWGSEASSFWTGGRRMVRPSFPCGK